ncbi:MAG: hypothetical protein K2G90_07650 [Muribaculaceae bacterium]|nr:hypothetical protein [Muribaculaceae bacterium]
MDNLTGLISTIVTFIVGTCCFLFRHTLKSIFIDPSSNPKLFFQDKNTKLSIEVIDIPSLINNVKSKVKAEIEKEHKIYKPRPLNPYDNPMLMLPDYAFQVKMQNFCNDLYLTSKEEYLQRRGATEIINAQWKLIDIYIVNLGKIATKPMLVKVKINTNNVYKSSKIRENNAKCYLPPTGKEVFHRDVVVSPDFYLQEQKYKYLEVTGESFIQDTLTYEINNPVRQGDNNQYLLDSIYIDTSEATEIDIEWCIYEDTLGKKGNHGNLKINCNS